MQALSIEPSSPLLPRDHRNTLRARTARLKVNYLVLADVLAIFRIFGASPHATPDSPGGGTTVQKIQGLF